jgi:hypothetical protein
MDRPQAGGYKESLLDEQNALAIQLFAAVATAVATALWAVLFAVKDGAVEDRPQAGGYNFFKNALIVFLFVDNSAYATACVFVCIDDLHQFQREPEPEPNG